MFISFLYLLLIYIFIIDRYDDFFFPCLYQQIFIFMTVWVLMPVCTDEVIEFAVDVCAIVRLREIICLGFIIAVIAAPLFLFLYVRIWGGLIFLIPFYDFSIIIVIPLLSLCLLSHILLFLFALFISVLCWDWGLWIKFFPIYQLHISLWLLDEGLEDGIVIASIG